MSQINAVAKITNMIFDDDYSRCASQVSLSGVRVEHLSGN